MRRHPQRGQRPREYEAGLPITKYTSAQLVHIVRWVQSDTLLRTEDELVQEVMTELGFTSTRQPDRCCSPLGCQACRAALIASQLFVYSAPLVAGWYEPPYRGNRCVGRRPLARAR